VSGALNTWLASVPDGSTIIFRQGGTYRLSQALQIANRAGLVLDGNGATLFAVGTGNLNSGIILGHRYGGFWTGTNRNIVIRNLTIVGTSLTPGIFNVAYEHQHAIQVEDSVGVEIANVTVRAIHGDALKVGGNVTSGVVFRDSHVESVGRNGVTVTAGSNVTVERVAFDRSGYCVFDVEPNSGAEVARNVRFVANTAGSWGNVFLAVEGSHTGATIDGIIVDGNVISGDSLRTIIDNGGTARMRNIAVTNNLSAVAAAGPVLRFAHVDGLTITGNVQPLSSGVLASITDSTGVTYR
jgi:hypothetical protein